MAANPNLNAARAILLMAHHCNFKPILQDGRLTGWMQRVGTDRVHVFAMVPEGTGGYRASGEADGSDESPIWVVDRCTRAGGAVSIAEGLTLKQALEAVRQMHLAYNAKKAA